MAEFNDFLSIVLILWLIVGLYNPKKGIFWEAESKTRGKFILYFISAAVAVTIIQMTIKPNPSEETVASDYSETQSTSSAEQGTEIDSSKIRPITKLISHFDGLTDLQQDEWNSNHKWEYVVKGNGQVTEVGETGFMSEDDSFPYEVTIELSEGQRAVVYYPKAKRDYVLGLNKGSNVSFSGRLKSITDWGFWKTGYVKYVELK